MLALAVAAFLVAARDHAALAWVLRHPGSLDGRSFFFWLSYGVWPLVLAGGVWLAGWGLGRRLLRPAAGVEETAAAALGLGLLASIVALLGWAGALSTGPLGAAAAVFAAAGWTALPRPRLPASPKGFAANIAAGLLLFVAFHLLVVSLAPPTEWDARAYHLALPELYLRHGGIVDVPWLIQSHWPHLFEVLYSLPLSLGRDGAAALLHAGACALLVGAVGSAGGWPAALVLAGQPAFLRGAPVAHADGACALLLFAAGVALAREGKKGRIALAGLLAGLAVSAKLFGAAGAASWTLWLLWTGRRRDAAVFAACAAAACAPWFLATWARTGDPVWPLLRLTPESAALAARYSASNLWSSPPSWLLRHHGPGFLLVPLAGLAFLAPKSKAGTLERVLWIPVPALFLLAFRHHEAWRFMTSAYAPAALACGRLAASASDAGGWRRIAAGALVALAASPLLALTQNNELFAVLAVRSEAAPEADPRALFEERSVDAAAFYREARPLVPPGAKVLLWRETRGYRAGFSYLWGDPMNQALVDWRALPGPEEAYARLKALNVGYVLAHPGSALYQEDPAYYDARTLALMDALLARHGEPLLTRDGFVLHRLL